MTAPATPAQHALLARAVEIGFVSEADLTALAQAHGSVDAILHQLDFRAEALLYKAANLRLEWIRARYVPGASVW